MSSYRKCVRSINKLLGDEESLLRTEPTLATLLPASSTLHRCQSSRTHCGYSRVGYSLAEQSESPQAVQELGAASLVEVKHRQGR